MILEYFSSKGYRGLNRWRAGRRGFFFLEGVSNL
jgi:hypothetical protein